MTSTQITFLLGYYCLVNSTDYVDKPCPSGHYCPAGTEYSDQYKCSIGTFNPIQLQTDVSACLNCTAGTYCQTTGLSNPTANCRYGSVRLMSDNESFGRYKHTKSKISK